MVSRISKIDPDRYADTGFSVKDTPPEVNAMIFQRMMALTPGERLSIGMSMMATAKTMVWASLPEGLTEEERRRAFLERFYGDSLEAGVIDKVAKWRRGGEGGGAG